MVMVSGTYIRGEREYEVDLLGSPRSKYNKESTKFCDTGAGDK